MANEITMYKGDNYTAEVTVVDENGSAVNITGSGVIFTVRPSLDSADITFQRKNLAAGGDATQIEMTDPANGVFKLYIVPANTSGITSKTYVYDFQVTLATGEVYTVIQSTLEIEEDVTK